MTKDVNALNAALQGGGCIPLLGFGTWQLEGAEAYQATRTALDIGYRHIDTATAYSNEDRVGAALRDSGVDRGELFITTKCPPERAGDEPRTLEESLSALGVDFVDLWLVHWPPSGQARPSTWRQFIAAVEAGKARSIGVSNYSVAQVDELVEVTGKAPAVNQNPVEPVPLRPRHRRRSDRSRHCPRGLQPAEAEQPGAPVACGAGSLLR